MSASADGFDTLTSRIPVGVNVASEFVLQRSVPLADATNNLWGITYAAPSKPGDTPFSAYTGVKVEILDGPLAGIFTFSDEAFGGYQISGVPPGRIHVRASADHLEAQTLDVVVSGNTKLDFIMKGL